MQDKTDSELRAERGATVEPQGQTGLGTIDLYYERKYYKSDIAPNIPNVRMQDFWYEKPLYGLVDQKANIIYPSEKWLKQLRSKQMLLALNFVVDAFEDFKDFMSKAVTSGQINPEKSVYGSIEPRRAWESVHVGYHKIVQLHYAEFFSSWSSRKNRNLKINSFDQFLSNFMEYLLKVVDEFPFNRTQFILSKYCSSLISGLIIDLNNKDHNNDYIKSEVFLNDPNFEFFSKAANKFGFMVDKNAPWRLVADVGSSVMKKYMANYDLTFDNFFQQVYYQAKLSDLDSFKDYMRLFYEKYVKVRPDVHYPVRDELGGTGMEMKKRKVTSSDAIKSISDTTWLRYYIKIRFKELGFEPINNNLLINIISVCSALGTEQALELLDKEIGGFKSIAFPKERLKRFN